LSKRFSIVATDLKTANEIVARFHRHSDPVGVAMRQVIATNRTTGDIIGTGILGRPVSLILDDGLTLEVSRTATDGTEHACSAILGALAREAQRLTLSGNHVHRLTTYTRASESGASLRAAGWRLDVKHHSRFVLNGLAVERKIVPIQPKSWSNPSRPRPIRAPGEPRLRWIKLLPPALTEEGAFAMGEAAASAGALIDSNPFSYPIDHGNRRTTVVFEGDNLWELWREGYGVGPRQISA